MKIRAANKVAVWLDCDPGHDDAIAIVLACYHPNIRLLGISTVSGNREIEKVTENALRILTYAGLSNTVDVYQGASKPLLRPTLHAEWLHGNSGMDLQTNEGKSVSDFSENYPVTQKKSSQKPQLALRDAILNNPQTNITVVCIGPLTNIALFLALYPELVPKIKIVCMGGCIGLGNLSPAAEFNFLADPHAASMVFRSGVHITMIPLEVTHTALFTPKIAKKMFPDRVKTEFQNFILSLLQFFAKTYKEVYRFDSPPIHDPCAVFCAIAPQHFKTEFMAVDIETSSQLCAGRSVCDVYGISALPKNCYVGKSMNVDEYWKSVIEAVKLANKHSPLNMNFSK